jgi:hypothetical protein
VAVQFAVRGGEGLFEGFVLGFEFGDFCLVALLLGAELFAERSDDAGFGGAVMGNAGRSNCSPLGRVRTSGSKRERSYTLDSNPR